MRTHAGSETSTPHSPAKLYRSRIADEIIEHLKKLEKAYPGLDRVSISPSLGVPKTVILEQVERFAKEVMPAFKGKTLEVKEPALAK